LGRRNIYYLSFYEERNIYYLKFDIEGLNPSQIDIIRLWYYKAEFLRLNYHFKD